MIATFMPKPFAHLTGNGCHFHMQPLEGRRERLRLDASTTRRHGPVASSPTTSSAA